MPGGSGASSLFALSVTDPTVGGDNNVWGNELNVIVSQLVTTVNQLIQVVQAQDQTIQTLTGGSTGSTGMWA